MEEALNVSAESMEHSSAEPETGESGTRDEAVTVNFTRVEKREVAAAFRILAATRSPDKEGNNFGAAASRDDNSVCALAFARNIESCVVALIAKIGEIVVNGEQSETSCTRRQSARLVRGDSVFEYFCEQRIINMLVEIVKEKRSSVNTVRSSEGFLHGVVWSPLVKAQVLRTTSLLISDERDQPVLFYLLSNDRVNDMITCMLPLLQWTDPALERMLPAYVHLLSTLALQLISDPLIFPFLTKPGSPAFPLFSAALEAASCVYAQSDCNVYENCLNVIISIVQSSHQPIRLWLSDAGCEQQQLAEHLCQCLLDRYRRICNLSTGPVVDAIRSNAIAGQIASLHEQIAIVNEVFWSGVGSLNVRLCECLLRKVVSVVLKNLVPERPFLNVGIVDGDVVPEREASAQVSWMFLAQLFTNLEYAPFQRMLAVSVLHSRSIAIWFSPPPAPSSSEAYVLVPSLNALAEGKADSCETIQNPFRVELIKSLKGEYGEWRLVVACILLESVLQSDAIDRNILALLDVIPQFHGHKEQPTTSIEEYPATSIEEALVELLNQHHAHSSPVTTQALECVGSLGLLLIYYAAMEATEDGTNVGKIRSILASSPLWIGLASAWKFFCINALKSQEATGVADIFLDLVEAALSNRFTAHTDESGVVSYVGSLTRHGCAAITASSEVLVRKFRGVSTNDVETARFHIHQALHFRSLCIAVERLVSDLEQYAPPSKSPRRIEKLATALDLTERADELSRTIAGMSDKPPNGTDLDLRGRMTFRFYSIKAHPKPITDFSEMPPGRLRSLSEDMGVFRTSSHFVLVLDPTDMFVVKPSPQIEFNRGTIITSISLRNVIAAASDGEWLHVAVRHEDVGFLIKNGTLHWPLGFCCVLYLLCPYA